ncbi:MAG: hypothetical protein AABX33_06805 [Nanoarchaeota archaeon]
MHIFKLSYTLYSNFIIGFELFILYQIRNITISVRIPIINAIKAKNSGRKPEIKQLKEEVERREFEVAK